MKQKFPGANSLVSRRMVLRAGAAVAAGTLLKENAAFAFSLPGDHLPGEAKNETSSNLRTQCEYVDRPLGLQEAQPRLSWYNVNAESAAQTRFQVAVSSKVAGPADLWDSGEIASADQFVPYGGRPLLAHQRAFWRVRTWDAAGHISEWSKDTEWSAGPLSERDWEGAVWIGGDDLLESTQEGMPGGGSPVKEPNYFAAPYLRKTFEVNAKITSALLYVCGLGFSEVYLNGTKVGDAEREPGFTNFDRSALYVTHDVTNMLQQGRNAVGAILGTGWYDVHDLATWHMHTAPWRQRPRLLLTLVLQHSDGSQTFVTSDSSWKASYGPILRDGIYTGEIYDARREITDWASPLYNDQDWSAALVVEAPRGKLKPRLCDPVRITETILPRAISEPSPGTYIVDLGKNISGHMQLRVRGTAGTAIKMRYAELLNADGSLNAKPIERYMQVTRPTQRFQQDTYICKGDSQTEVWEQRFSWSGFQFAEVTNFPGKPDVSAFRGRFAHTDLRSAGEFECSDEVANHVQAATLRSFLSNTQSYPTDCPQREKNGWTGDAGVAVETGLLNFQSASFYLKWLEDLEEAQRPDGGLPVLVPNGGWGNGERWPGDICPPWDAAYPIITWELYRATGDLRILQRHIQPLSRYVEFFLKHRAPDGLAPKLGLGDYCPYRAITSVDFITNVYLYHDLQLLSKMYAHVGDTSRSRHFMDLAEDTRKKIHEKFYSAETHRYSNGTQTAQGMALHFNIVPDSNRGAVFADLVSQVESMGHLDVGFLGAKFVTRALAEGRRADLAYRACMRTEIPGYGYWTDTMKSSTLWETWNGGGSYNHIMFGDISAWLMQWIAGLQQEQDKVGYRALLFRPQPVSGLTSARARYLTPYGETGISWALQHDSLLVELSVPSGAEARLLAPNGFHFEGSSAATERLVNGTHRRRLVRYQ